MRTIYFDCSMGAAGDMLTAALLELLPDPAAFVDRLNALGIPGVEFRAEASTKCGIQGTHMSVTVHGVEEEEHHHHESPVTSRPSPEASGHHHEHDHDDHHHHHGHHGLHGIEHLVRDHLALPEAVREDVLAVYRLLAEAESKVHGVPVEEIHFHEVGSMDAVADVTAVCLLLRELAPAQVLASPVHVGCGQVRCAHGLMPVPAPATAELLKGVPIYGGAIQGELCTPTGAALLKYYVNSFGAMPPMRTEAVGYGMGRKDFPAANCVRALLGETEAVSTSGPSGETGRQIAGATEAAATEEASTSRLSGETGRQIAGATEAAAAEEASTSGRSMSTPTAEDGTETVLELRCNLDDMTAEDIAFAAERLLEAGALDVWTQAIGMKKSRPGTTICVLCKPSDREALVSLLFRHTTTLGVREAALRRTVLDRKVETVQTQFGPVRRKAAEGFGVRREKFEYEDLSRIAKEHGLTLKNVRAVLDGEGENERRI